MPATISAKIPVDCRLLIDVGGTNVRFGLSHSPAAETEIYARQVSEFETFEAALAAFLTARDISERRITSAAVAAAGPVTADEICITNTKWVVSPRAIKTAIASDVPIYLLNDLEAVAAGLPHIPNDQVHWIKGGISEPRPNGRKLVVNVGTGFGSATLIETHSSPNGDAARSRMSRYACCPAESGHMLLGAGNLADLELLERLGPSPITVESVLSGAGVQRLARAMSTDREQDPEGGRSPDLIDLSSDDLLATATSRMFSRFLGETVANLVLASAAWNGVYLCGSVASAWAKSADLEKFNADFVGATPMRHMLTATPIGLITHELPSFVGLAHLGL